MATVATSITRVRRLIKDTGSSIFTDARLLRLYNIARRRFFRESRIRVRGAVLPNPSVIFYGISQRWEAGHISSLSFWEPFFLESVNYRSCCQPWEIQTTTASETSDSAGGYCITSPQEVIHVEQVNLVPHVLPEEFHELLYIAYKDKTVYVKNKEWLVDYDSNWKTRQGDEVLFASLDIFAGEKKFFPFPCPTDESTEISRDGAIGAGFLSYVESGDPDDLDWSAGSVGSPLSTEELLTDFAEVDPNSKLTVGNYSITFDSLSRDESAYVYRDCGVDYWDGDFEHRLVTKATAYSDFGFVAVWALANSVADAKALLDAGGSLFLAWYWNGSEWALYLREAPGDGTVNSDNSIALAADTPYYVVIVRDESVGTYGVLRCYIYSDSGYTTLVDTLIITLQAKVDWRYLYAIQSHNDALARTLSGTVSNLATPKPPNLAGPVYDITKINAEDEGTGVVLEIATSSEGFTVFFICVPQDIAATSETDILPRPFRKYIEFLCAALALESDTDLKDSQKAQLLRVRYGAGVSLAKIVRQRLKSDRVYRLEALGELEPHGIGRRRPRFPAHYPRVW